jgi:hypothetical protein
VDDLQTGQRWKFRYPIVNGEAAGALAVSKDLKPGTYAFNFLVSNQHLEVNGRIRSVKLKMAMNYKTGNYDTIAVFDKPGSMAQQVSYSIMNRAGFVFDSVLRVDEQGNFRVPPMIFGDTARLIFKMQKDRDDYLVEVATPLDSAFKPFFSKTVFVNIKGADRVKKADTSKYSFNFADPYPGIVTLEEVKVKGLTKLQQFEKDNVSQWFKSPNARTFDGLESNAMSTYNDIWDYLRANVVGLTVSGLGFERSALWRGTPVTFFLDEVMIDPNLIMLHPADIAMIKAYPPSVPMPMEFNGSVVAIYSKRGGGIPRRPGYAYSVTGYTPGASQWKGN